jgi:hypothetical protein
MDKLYIVLKHLSGIALLYFIVTLILLITDLENIAKVDLYTWGMNLILFIGFFTINRWCNKKMTEAK